MGCRTRGTDHLLDHAEGFDNAGTRAVEEPIPVGDEQAAGLNRLQAHEVRALGEPVHFSAGAGEIESAGGHDHDVGIPFQKFFPCNPRGVDAGFSEDIDAAGQLDEFRGPVSGGHDRLDPFNAGYGRTNGRVDWRHAALKLTDDGLGVDTNGFADAAKIVPDIGERRRVQGDKTGRTGEPRGDRLLDVTQTHGADVALDLREDVGRLQAFQHVIEYFVDGERAANGVLHLRIDGAAVGVDINQRSGATRKRADGGRIVAFVRTADEKIKGTESVDDLGGAGDKRNDGAIQAVTGRLAGMRLRRSSYRPNRAPE